MSIVIQTNLRITGVSFTFPRIGGGAITIDQTNPGGGVPGYQKLTADTPEAIDISELTAAGVGFIRNIHATTVVQIGKEVAAVFEPLLEIRPGEEFPLPHFVAGVAPFLKAIGAEGEVQLYIFED